MCPAGESATPGYDRIRQLRFVLAQDLHAGGSMHIYIAAHMYLAAYTAVGIE